MENFIKFVFSTLFDVVEFKCSFKHSYYDDFLSEKVYVFDCRMYIDNFYKCTFTITCYSYTHLRLQLLNLTK